MGKLLSFLFFFYALISLCQSRRFVFITPSVLQVGIEHKVIVTLYNDVRKNVGVKVSVELEDRTKIYSGTAVQVSGQQGESVQVSIRVLQEALKNLSPTPQHVYVRAKSTSRRFPFNKRKRVALSLKSFSVLVQTDKPVYIRNDEVNIRIITVNSRLVSKPLENVVVDILDPRNVTVDRTEINSAQEQKITRRKIQLGINPVIGDWTILAKYGFKKNLTSRFNFKVKDYVLPQFDVKITPPLYVLKRNQHIELSVQAKYTFDKVLLGYVAVELGVWISKSKISVFRKTTHFLLPNDHGSKNLTIPNSGYGVFPFGKRLWIRATVTERGSGVRFTKTDMTATFTCSPYRIEFDRSKPFYTPGMPLESSVKVTYPNGHPAAGINLNFSDQFGQKYTSISDNNGFAKLTLNTNRNSTNMTCQVKPAGEQVITEFVYLPFEPTCTNPSSQFTIKLGPTDSAMIKVGNVCQFEIIVTELTQKKIDMTFLVFSHGLIQHSTTSSLSKGFNTLCLFIEPHWSEKFHLIGYYYDQSCDSISADVLAVQVEPDFSNKIEIRPQMTAVSPGSTVTLEVRTEPNSDVVLLAVDSDMYALNNKNKLTREQVFDHLKDFDISCPVEDFNSEGLFNAIGLSVLTNLDFTTTERADTRCPGQQTRRKQNAQENENDKCCTRFVVSLEAKLRNEIENLTINKQEEMLNTLCNSALETLVEGQTRVHSLSFRCVLTDDCLEKLVEYCPGKRECGIEVVGNYPIEDELIRRSYFPHVWLVDKTFTSDQNGILRTTVNVPDSITSWILQGMSLSSSGFGVAKPKTLRAYKSVFIECRMPFSARRLEQISIVCLAYNFNGNDLYALVQLLNIPESICTSAGVGSTQFITRELIPKGTSSHPIVIHVVPLDLGTHRLTVRLLTTMGTDEVVYHLKVEPEGIRIDQLFTVELDPQDLNFPRRQRCRSAPDPELEQTCFDSRSCSARTHNGARMTKDECCDVRNFYWTPHGWGDNCETCPLTGIYRRTNVSKVENGKAQDNYFRLVLPEDVVPESDQAFVTITGSYLQNAKIRSPRAKQLQGLPSDTNEQTVFALGISVANLRYMKFMGKDGSSQYRDLLSATKQTFQNVIDQQNKNGSYRAYWSQSSTYFMATTLTILTSASEFVFVDKKILEDAKDVVASRMKDSCILEDQESDMNFNIVSLAAHAIASFSGKISRKVFCPKSGSDNCICCSNHRIINSFRRWRRDADDYTRSWVFYAMTLACLPQNGDNCCNETFREILRVDMCKAAQTRKGRRFWSDEPDADDVATSRAITTTAIMLCAYVAKGDIEEARPVARWLSSVRNTNLELPSTESTYWTQECLTAFSRVLQQQRNLKVKSSVVNDSFANTVKVDDSNRDVEQSFKIPSEGLLKVTTTGNGVGFMQVKLSYNTIKYNNEKCHFTFTVNTSNLNNSTENEKQVLVSLCIRHQLTVSANSVTVEVKIPTGYSPCDEATMGNTKDKRCLDEILLKMGDQLGLESYENYDSTVFFHLKQVPSKTDLCIHFKLLEKLSVQSRTPVFAKVYKDEERGAYCAVPYSVDNKDETLTLLGCSKNSATLCVCAAGRCPKLGPIKNRICQACNHHHYAFKVRVTKIVQKDAWYQIRCDLQQVIKPGTHPTSNRILFWMRDVCYSKVNLKVEETYHVMGLESSKFVLDHNSLIEEWPKYTDRADPNCIKRKADACIRKKCKSKGRRGGRRHNDCVNSKKTICKRQAKGNCLTGFTHYLEDMGIGHVCERSDLCK
ncbi:A.superbus venom factor 1-like isoform X2 [Corticium candelabrum]|uniref:A.superbus venom factor 1-like isoform X2 n=1 Tax=Corticium candelabrum TaxID=121492 RepID=UPI002E26946A|nr:A.superbus venom factor 1-like isoform X2 [Corticium candelabrum]